MVGDLDPTATVAPVGFGPGAADLVYEAGERLYWVDLSGGTPGMPQPLSDAPGTGETVEMVHYAPDGSWVAWWLGSADQGDLHVAPLGGGQPVETSVGGPDVVPAQVQVSADGTRLAWLAGNPAAPESWVVDMSGGAPGTPAKASGNVSGDGVTRQVLASDGTALAYVAAQGGPSRALWWVDLSGGAPAAPVELSGTIVSGGDVADEVVISPDGARVAYLADAETAGKVELFEVELGGGAPGAPARLSGDLPAGGQVFPGLAFSPDAIKVFFVAADTGDGPRTAYELDLARDAPGSPVAISGSDDVGSLHVLAM